MMVKKFLVLIQLNYFVREYENDQEMKVIFKTRDDL